MFENKWKLTKNSQKNLWNEKLMLNWKKNSWKPETIYEKFEKKKLKMVI